MRKIAKVKIHPMDVFRILQTAESAKLHLKRPWWGWLIPRFMGPYKGSLIINGVEYEQDIKAYRLCWDVDCYATKQFPSAKHYHTVDGMSVLIAQAT